MRGQLAGAEAGMPGQVAHESGRSRRARAQLEGGSPTCWSPLRSTGSRERTRSTSPIGLDRRWPTAGLRATGRRNRVPRLVIRDGQLAALGSPAPSSTWAFPPPFGDQPVVQLPFSEVITLARPLDVDELRSHLNTAPLEDLHDPATGLSCEST